MQVKNLFVTLDTNNDGSIDTKELRKGLKAFGYSLADAEVEQLMNRMDLNQARFPTPITCFDLSHSYLGAGYIKHISSLWFWMRFLARCLRWDVLNIRVEHTRRRVLIACKNIVQTQVHCANPHFQTQQRLWLPGDAVAALQGVPVSENGTLLCIACTQAPHDLCMHSSISSMSLQARDG